MQQVDSFIDQQACLCVLQPENILLSDKTPAAVLKVIDFGTSDFCLDGQRLSQKFGTPYYVAPEVCWRGSRSQQLYRHTHRGVQWHMRICEA